MAKRSKPEVLPALEVFEALLEAAVEAGERNRSDLFAKALDEVWLLARFPGDREPPAELVAELEAARVRRYGEGAR